MNTRILMRGALALLAALMGGVPGLAAATDAGRVIAVSGEATVLRNGQRLPIQKKLVLASGDTVITGETGRVRWQMSDESYFTLTPNSRFRIDDYAMSDDQTGKAFYRLQDGGVATLSGLIKSPQSYRLQTPAASISVRGTRYRSAYCTCADQVRTGTPLENGLYVGVDEGMVIMANSAGSLEVKAGQYGFAADDKTAPRLLYKAPSILLDNDLSLDVEVRAEADVAGNRIERRVQAGTRVVTEPPASPF